MKHLLLIGGAGYVGSVAIGYFLNKGYRVTLLDNFIYGNHSGLLCYLGNKNFKIVYGGFETKSALELSYDDTVSDVVLFGGLVGDPITKKYPEDHYLINDLGVKKCIDFFDDKNLDTLIFTSTCSNYGLIKESELADEEFELNPLSLYAKAKVSAEQHLMSKKGNVAYSATVLRFATAFGLSPRMRFDLTISEFVKEIYFGKDLLVYDEDTWRPYCHVQDFSRLLEIIILDRGNKAKFQTYNAGGDNNNYTKKMVVDQILKEIPDAKIKYGDLGSDPRNYRVSFNKVKSEFNFEPQFSVVDGIKELINVLNLGFFRDTLTKKNNYGNYTLEEKG